MGGLDPRENHIHRIVLLQVMWNLSEGSAKIRVIGTGAGTRATGMCSDARWVQSIVGGHDYSQGRCS